ncbi:hypothetical protein GE061_015270 [Apolygus lucorum]|uniref:Uncharacterized protein n=1 Tax=Apolygus lucorum TaxID=248454 RepID=A0A8S9XKH8_APOLU|nr:hypothetical protein GE061_015270 [Apolygus lucorum]
MEALVYATGVFRQAMALWFEQAMALNWSPKSVDELNCGGLKFEALANSSAQVDSRLDCITTSRSASSLKFEALANSSAQVDSRLDCITTSRSASSLKFEQTFQLKLP